MTAWRRLSRRPCNNFARKFRNSAPAWIVWKFGRDEQLVARPIVSQNLQTRIFPSGEQPRPGRGSPLRKPDLTASKIGRAGRPGQPMGTSSSQSSVCRSADEDHRPYRSPGVQISGPSWADRHNDNNSLSTFSQRRSSAAASDLRSASGSSVSLSIAMILSLCSCRATRYRCSCCGESSATV